MKRSSKIKMMHQPGNLIALGSTSAASSTSSPSSTAAGRPTLDIPSSSNAVSTIKLAPKREPPSPNATPAKKPKMSMSGVPSVTHLVTRSSGAIQMRRESGNWDEFAIEVKPKDLLKAILDAENKEDDERCEAYVCGAVKQLKANRSKPDPCLYLSLLYLAKIRPLFFGTDNVTEAFCSLLRKDPNQAFNKSKGNNLCAVLAANIMLAAFHDEASWPDVFLKVFVEDCLGDRIWVDNEDCKGFVDNLLTAFGTKMPPKRLLSQESVFGSGPSSTSTPGGLVAALSKESNSASPAHQGDDIISLNEDSSNSLLAETKELLGNIQITPRYQHNQAFVNQYIQDVVQEHITRRSATGDVSRNLLKLLIVSSGQAYVRNLVSQKMESWLGNPKLTRPAQDVLLAVCMNCNDQDVEAVTNLMKMRPKTKPLNNHLNMCFKELMNQHENNMNMVVRHAILNELSSSSRNQNNMQLLSLAFQQSNEKAVKIVANVFQELLLSKEDYSRSLRSLLREIVRNLRHEHLNLSQFASSLMNLDPVLHIPIIETDSTLRDRFYTAVIDIVTMCIFLSITPSVKESISITLRSEKRDALRLFQMQVARIQRDFVQWLYGTATRYLRPDRNEFMHGLNKVLFMEPAESYYNKDGWPPENDRNYMLRLSSEVPLLEETLMLILNMAQSKEHHLTPAEAVELLDALIKRAANSCDTDPKVHPVLPIQDPEVFEKLISCCIYRPPENITLPSGYVPPRLAITDLYWKVWIQLLILTAHNAAHFGKKAWTEYPTLSVLIEMCITNHFEFPPPSMSGEGLLLKESQISELEKSQILEFESHLAAASTKMQITETNSLLLSKVILLDSLGPARQPPPGVLEQLRIWNSQLKLNILLCQNRNPDFVLEIIGRQHKSQDAEQANVSWLTELVEANEGNLSVLPVQCLCEFVFNEIKEELEFEAANEISKNDKHKLKDRRKKLAKLVSHLQSLIDTDGDQTANIMEYFMKQLSYQQSLPRNLASKALNIILDSEWSHDLSESDGYMSSAWLRDKLPNIKSFVQLQGNVCIALRRALLYETITQSICDYVSFLAEYDDHNNESLNTCLGRLIVDRQILISAISRNEKQRSLFISAALRIFHSYLSSLRTLPGYQGGCSRDKLLVKWTYPQKVNALVPIPVVHGSIILLGLGTPESTDKKLHDQILNMWFSEPRPHCFIGEPPEEALLLPDWLRIRLLKTNSKRLVEAALKECTITQMLIDMQHFGLSSCAMEQILRSLDQACDIQPEALKTNISDEAMVRQILEVEWMRGVSNGQKLGRLVGKVKEKPPEPTPTPKTSTKPSRKGAQSSSSDSKSGSSQKVDVPLNAFNTEATVKRTFTDRLQTDDCHRIAFIKECWNRCGKELMSPSPNNSSIPVTLGFLSSCILNLKNPYFIVLLNSNEFNPIFSLIVKFALKRRDLPEVSNKLRTFIKNLGKCADFKCEPLENILSSFTTQDPGK